MQAQVSSAALQSDTLKASALAADVSSAPPGAASQAKPVVLLIHGGAQGGWVWSYPNEVRAHRMLLARQVSGIAKKTLGHASDCSPV